jgi:hypothetical protein
MQNIPFYFCNIRIKHLQHTSKTYETLQTYLCNMCFYPCSSIRRNAKQGMGRRRAALSRPLLEASGGGGGDRPSTSFGRCGRRRHKQAERERGDRLAMGTGCLRAIAEGKGLATGAGSCRRALAGRGWEQGDGGELWPNRG